MSTYDRRLVEQLLPAVWDAGYAYGMDDPTAPDPDMPTPTADPAISGTLYAHLADIKAAWSGACIPLAERQALLLRYGLDLNQADVGRRLGISQRTASERLAQGVGRIVDHLNGHAAAAGF